MSYLVDGYHREVPVAAAPVDERVAFIRRTYGHLAGAVVAFVALEAILLASGVGLEIVKALFTFNGAWIGLMVLFIAGGFAAQYMARSSTSRAVQYAGLGLYVLLETLIF